MNGSMARAGLVLAAVLIWTSPSLADPPATLWSRTYGGTHHDRANALCDDGSGGFLLAGFADSHPILHPSDLWLLNVDADGDTLWTRKYGGESHEAGNAVRPTADGGFIVTGFTRSFGPATPADNLWLLRIDAAGDTLWTRAHGGDYYDYGYDVLPTDDGGYLVAGEWGDYGCGSSLWLLKTDAAGDEVWSRRYGSSYFNCAHAVAATDDGGFLVAGRTELRLGDAYHDDLWLLRTDASGDTLWTRRYGGEAEDRALSVCALPDGGSLLAGHTASFGAGGRDIWLLRCDAAGDTLWTRTYGGAGQDYAESLQLVPGGCVIAGHTNSFGPEMYARAWLLCCDAAGDTLWTALYGDDQTCTARAVHLADDGGLVLAGALSIGFMADVWVLRTAAAPDGVADLSPPVAGITLGAAPNPFGTGTEIRFALGRPQTAQLDIVDLRGALVARLADESMAAGPRRYAWDGRDRYGRPAPSGVYFARLRLAGHTASSRLLLVR